MVAPEILISPNESLAKILKRLSDQCLIIHELRVTSIQIRAIKLEPWASKTARHYSEGLDMQRNE